ncbi:MAG: alpha/beta hydrolase [Anaerolineales bacterium]
MDLTNAIAQWMLSQIETMPADLGRSLSRIKPHLLLDLVLSDREAAEVRALLDQPPSDHPRKATVFIPGIMGSQLSSVRGISAPLWLNPQVLLDGHLNLLDLDDDGVSDRSPDVDIMPLGIEKLTYLQIILTLARETRLYEFPYDWRHSICRTADILAASLERWAIAAPERRFTLIGHSMGGLVARAYLARHPRQAERRVERVIMLGTPLQGAPEAALLFVGEAMASRQLRHLNPNNDVVSFASNLPSVYQLLPPPPELLYGSDGYPCDWDLYDARAWGLEQLRADLLADALAFHKQVRRRQPDIEQIELAGCHSETIIGVHREVGDDGSPVLVPEYQAQGPNSGDEQVPLWSTTLPEVTTYYVEMSHNALVQTGPALDAVLALLHDDPVMLPTTVPPVSEKRRPFVTIPLVQQMNEVRRHLAAGRLSREDLRRIFFTG